MISKIVAILKPCLKKQSKEQAIAGNRARAATLQAAPKGSRNKATLIAEQLLRGSGEEIVSKAIDMAKTDNPVALRLCIERPRANAQRGNVVESGRVTVERRCR
jgi:hypothetical protein